MCNLGHDVVPVLYSYGCLVGGAALERFYKEDREATGEVGGIVGVMMATCPLLAKKGITATENLSFWNVHDWFGCDGWTR